MCFSHCIEDHFGLIFFYHLLQYIGGSNISHKTQLLKQKKGNTFWYKIQQRFVRINEWVKSNHSNLERVGDIAEYQRWGQVWAGINRIAKNRWIE